MTEVLVKVIDQSCAWGSGSDCCDSLESDLAGYPEGATWELPLRLRLQVVEAQVHELTGTAVRVQETELLSLTGPDREAAIEGLTTGGDFPLVIVSGTLACHGGFDLDRIADAVRTAASV